MRYTWWHNERLAARSSKLQSEYDEDWTIDAACADYDPDIWFPEWPKPNEYSLARRICALCPVRQECLIESLEMDDKYGMFGGLTPGEREKLKHQKPPLIAA